MLVNAWIPLQQITQPLAFVDPRTLDRRRHQLRYGLVTSSFLERDDEMAINDIWIFLHDPDQRWFFRSQMDHTSAYLFNTLSTAHGAGTLPGEDVAERCYRSLEPPKRRSRQATRLRSSMPSNRSCTSTPPPRTRRRRSATPSRRWRRSPPTPTEIPRRPAASERRPGRPRHTPDATAWCADRWSYAWSSRSSGRVLRRRFAEEPPNYGSRRTSVAAAWTSTSSLPKHGRSRTGSSPMQLPATATNRSRSPGVATDPTRTSAPAFS